MQKTILFTKHITYYKFKSNLAKTIDENSTPATCLDDTTADVIGSKLIVSSESRKYKQVEVSPSITFCKTLNRNTNWGSIVLLPNGVQRKIYYNKLGLQRQPITV